MKRLHEEMSNPLYDDDDEICNAVRWYFSLPKKKVSKIGESSALDNDL